MRLRAGRLADLARYTARQLDLFGAAPALTADRLAALLPEALSRLDPITRAVKIFNAGYFDHLHSLQYATYLYLLGRVCWEQEAGDVLVDQLFLLNKSLCNLELHPAVPLPPVFFVSHGIGTVLGNATYGDRFVFFQNVTVGRIGEQRPRLGRGVILYAGSSVTGSAVLGDDVVVGANVHVHNTTVPSNSIVRSVRGDLHVEPLARDYLSLYLNRSCSVSDR